MSEGKVTARPWRVEKYRIGSPHSGSVVFKACGDWAVISDGELSSSGEGDARHIVKCVNAHDELVEALRRVANPDWNDIASVERDVDCARELLAKLDARAVSHE